MLAIRPLAAALTTLALTSAALAAPIPLNVLNTVGYTQNFDTLSNNAGSTTNTLALDGWAIAESGTSARVNGQYAVDTGSGQTGDTFSFGSAGSTDRALGTLRSGTITPSFGASFTNATGATITSLLVAYTGEQWRLGTAGRPDRLDFQYSLNASSLITGTWTDVDLLDFTAPSTAGTGNKDGNLAVNRTAISSTIANLSIAAGNTFWIRWTDFDATGANDGLAVDDFSLRANGVLAANQLPEPAGLALVALGLAAAAFARRRTR